MSRNSALLWFWLAATTVYAGQNVVVVLDDSGSMDERMRGDPAQTKINAAKDALRRVLEKLPADDTRVGIVLLNGASRADHWVYPLAAIDMVRLTEAIERIVANGGTPLGGRMKTGCDALLSVRATEHYGLYRLLIVTDGEATDADLVERYLPDILSRGIWVDVIGVDMAGDHSLATQVHTYRKADSRADLEKVIAEVLGESAADAGDVDESDFEIIAAIPDGVATAALEALSASGNHPVGEMPRPRAAQQAAVALGPDLPALPGPQQGVPVGEKREGGGSGAFFWVVVIVAIAGLVFFLRAAAKPKRS